jgi:single-stranded-DNA-specific exonuclease
MCVVAVSKARKELSESGIDTIIVDHHIPLEGWADPHALVNPHRTQGPGRELCSAGLAFKLAHALLGTRRIATLRSYLDLAALGTLSDCMPLVGDNRLIVAEGLVRIVESHRPGLRRVCEATQTTKADPGQIVKRLVPRFNASGRLGDPSAVRHLLQSDESDQTETWMEQAETAHATTKRLYRQMVAEAEEQVHRQHFGEQFVMVVSRAGWHQGLTGVLASQLAARYQRPAIAIALDAHRGIGSGRSIPRFNLLNALKACQALLVRFGGHAQACGLTVDGRQIEPFRRLINQHGRLVLGREGLVPTRMIDLELPLEAIQPQWVAQTQAFAPFGRGNERPTIVIRRVTIETTSPRVAALSDGKRGVEARGVWAGIRTDEAYDVVATPTLTEGDVRLMVSDVKASML